jgi:hypothetical protein
MQGQQSTPHMICSFAESPCRYTWDGVIHKVKHLQNDLGLRYMAEEWKMLDLNLEEDQYADLLSWPR